MTNPFKHGQGMTSDLLSQIQPRDGQELMLLEALHEAVSLLSAGEYHDGRLCHPSYYGRKAVEFRVREHYGCAPTPLASILGKQ